MQEVRVSKKISALILCTLITTLVLPKSYARQEGKVVTTDKPDVLKTLQKVCVIIENLSADAELDGLQKQQIRNDVELRLRQNGIEVVSTEEINKTPAQSSYYVNVHMVKLTNPAGSYAFHIRVELQETVIALRPVGTTVVGATVWQQHMTGITSASRVREIRADVQDLTDGFLNDYLAANPKK